MDPLTRPDSAPSPGWIQSQIIYPDQIRPVQFSSPGQIPSILSRSRPVVELTWPDPVSGGHLGTDLHPAVREAEGKRRAHGRRHDGVEDVLRVTLAHTAVVQRVRAPADRQWNVLDATYSGNFICSPNYLGTHSVFIKNAFRTVNTEK